LLRFSIWLTMYIKQHLRAHTYDVAFALRRSALTAVRKVALVMVSLQVAALKLGTA
jgi:hypothetical protein